MNEAAWRIWPWEAVPLQSVDDGSELGLWGRGRGREGVRTMSAW